LKDITDWLEPYRKLWEARFDRLEAYLQKIQADEATQATAPKDKEQGHDPGP
jgi:hypothetical protein